MTRNYFCPKCGVTLQKPGFCKECKPVKEINYKPVEFDICTNCDKIRYKNKWQDYKDFEESIKNIITTNVKDKVSKIKITMPEFKRNAGMTINFESDVKIGEDYFLIPGKFNVTYCDACRRIGTKYFEGILQIRNPTDEVIQYVEKELALGKKKGILVTEKKEVTGGYDYQITKKNFIRVLGKQLKKRFCGELKESPQLFSRNHQTSRDIYRINVLFRCEKQKPKMDE